MTEKKETFRQSIVNDEDECLVFGADNLSQFTQPAGCIADKCERALACATQKDIVLLKGVLDQGYQSWLRSLDLGTDHVVAYGALRSEKLLSELILKNPEPVKKAIRKTGKRPVYFPWLSDKTEALAAKAMGADLFGASPSLTLKYNHKVSFKQVCRDLEIPVIEGTCFNPGKRSHESLFALGEIAEPFLKKYDRIIIRAAMDNTGLSMVYKTDGNDLSQLHEKWLDLGIDTLMIEPFLTADFSPGDQWVINRKAEIIHKGMRNQILNGLWHKGNIRTDTPPKFDCRTIKEISHKIVTRMAHEGYVGVVGIDYIQTGQGIFPVENNARVNGSTYVKFIVENIQNLTGTVPCWKSLKAKTAPNPFQHLAKTSAGILYDGKKNCSYFPYNCDNLEKTGAYAVILMAPDLEALEELEGEMIRAGLI
ncbi:hypothetical protein [Desulfobacter curvatus]|uniref:hypothetical protein n=1 Tax=Desulfobacter curvatus TaxID=2290 RepID=UPI00037694E2|nr:hypothetical protein [Desulfobacter curvatus]